MAASSNLSSKLSTLEVSNAISRLTVEETRELVFQMGVPLKVIDDIAEAYKGKNRKHHFVQGWLDMTPDSSWDKLVAGLRNINMNSLATAIESEHHPKALSTCDPSLPKPAAIPVSITSPHANSVEEVEANIEHLEKEFSDIKFKTRQSLTKKEKEDSDFFEMFREHLLELPVAKKQVHIRFFSRNLDEILKAENIQKLFIILGRHCNYSNYEIIFHVVKRFCHDLKGRMTGYRDSLVAFEKSTTVDVYLCAISARPGGEVSKGFIRMTTKINKPPSECSLYVIRELKESIEEAASLESYAMYIETPEEGSVCVGLRVHKEVVWMVGVAFTPSFRQIHLVTDVTVIRSELWHEDLSKYLKDELISASERGDVKVVTSLITAGVDVNVKNSWPGNCAITSAAREGRTEVVSLLLEAGANIDLQNKVK
ncbi:hypothetical protein GBAR_LOCUS4079 [Geodia barretti]|uniref:Death domain-containing protein n=1 Tax=Geodia barretti TaxID=519541 RepID=A0AA35W2M3_GEOBA|nr:hypothetical protein GBAR_LOCUS4079 [Geodia barretti]